MLRAKLPPDSTRSSRRTLTRSRMKRGAWLSRFTAVGSRLVLAAYDALERWRIRWLAVFFVPVFDQPIVLGTLSFVLISEFILIPLKRPCSRVDCRRFFDGGIADQEHPDAWGHSPITVPHHFERE